MPNALDWSVLNTKVETLRRELDLERREDAFAYLLLPTLLDLTTEEAGEAVTDGPADRGIDAFYLDERGGNCSLHLFNLKYVASVERSQRNFPGSEVDKVLSFVDEFLQKSEALVQGCHSRLADKIKYTWERFYNPDFRIILYFAGNCDLLEKTQRARISSHFLDRHYIDFQELSLEIVVNTLIRKLVPRVDGEVPPR